MTSYRHKMLISYSYLPIVWTSFYPPDAADALWHLDSFIQLLTFLFLLRSVKRHKFTKEAVDRSVN